MRCDIISLKSLMRILPQLRHPHPAGHHQLAERDGDALGHLPMDLGQLPLLQDGRQRMEGKSLCVKVFLKTLYVE